MNKSKFRNIISVFLAVMMIIGTFAVSVHGVDEPEAEASVSGQTDADGLGAGNFTTNEEAADSVTASASAVKLASLPGDDVTYGEDYRFCYGLGLFELLPDGYWQTEQVTRGDFAAITAKMLKANTAGYPRYSQTPYKDVDNTIKAYPAICYLTEIGILNGDGDSIFRPNDPITVSEATKMVMCALGYKEACEQTAGGFPEGYITFGLRSGIYSELSVDYGETMTAMQMSKMVRNAMETDLMESITYGSNGEQILKVSEGNSLLNEVYKINRASGYLAGTYYSMMVDGFLGLENEVLVTNVYKENLAYGSEYSGDVIYQTSENADLEEYLGYEVNIYYIEDVSGYKRDYITYCEPRAMRNQHYIINSDDITEFTNEKIVYSDESGKRYTINFRQDYTLFSLNGIPTDEIVVPREGNVKIITDGSAAGAKSVIISDFKDALVDRYSDADTTIGLQNSSELAVEDKKIRIDSDAHVKLTLNGTTMKPEELLKNDAITFTKSKDGKYVRGYISRDIISGTVST